MIRHTAAHLGEGGSKADQRKLPSARKRWHLDDLPKRHRGNENGLYRRYRSDTPAPDAKLETLKRVSKAYVSPITSPN